jgi:eukaryotic translation initiation factor 2C
MHPPPKVDKPSYASIVGSVDANASKYVATIRLQAPRVECIEKFGEMAKSIIQQYIDYRRRFEKKEGDAAYPKRIVFYRDGVDEGQFAKVKEKGSFNYPLFLQCL